MHHDTRAGGSAARWGPLFGARAHDWAATWEGARGWGGPAYRRVIEQAEIRMGTRVLDCGCGAGRFAQRASEAGAQVTGIDASAEMIAIAATLSPKSELVVGDLQALPWADDTFDVVTGFSSFQFADDKVRALAEARRVTRKWVAVVVPARVPESGITAVFSELLPLFPADALQSMKQSGMNALSERSVLEQALAAAELSIRHDDEIECPIVFDDPETAVRAFLGAGPMAHAIRHSGETAVAEATRAAVGPLTTPTGSTVLPTWFRVVLART